MSVMSDKRRDNGSPSVEEYGQESSGGMPPDGGSAHGALSFTRAVLAGLAAGGVAGVVAALVQLPLHSPDDIVLNSLTVVLAALVAGLGGGALWYALRGRRAPYRSFLMVMGAAFIVVVAGAVIADRMPNAPLSGVPGFVIPLAAIVLGGVALLTPVLSMPAARASVAGPVAAVAALGLGVALAGQGDAESGKLALPAAPAVDLSTGVMRPADVAGVTYTIDPSGSAVTYTVREKLANLPSSSDAVGKTGQVSGTIALDGRPSTITVDVSTFQSDQQMRDNFIRTNPNGPNLSQSPQAQLVVSDLALPAEYREGETVTQTVTGTMTIRGVTRPQMFTVEGRLTGGVLTLHATTDFTWADYGIPAPNVGTFIQVEDTVHIETLLTAPGSK